METSAATATTTAQSRSEQPAKSRLVDVKVTNIQESLQLLVTFLNLAQKRGAFSLDESAKIWECVQWFQRSEGEEGGAPASSTSAAK